MVRTFKYRLLPTKRQRKQLEAILESQRILYNAALEHRIGAFKRAAKVISVYTQMSELTQLRQDAEFSRVPVTLQRWTLRRLDAAYTAFFRRLKANGARGAGLPRYRSAARWSTFGFSHFKGVRILGQRIKLKGMPTGVRLHLHRPMPQGKPQFCTFTKDHKGWYVCLQYRMDANPLPPTGNQVGLDMGINELAVLSSSEAIPNPRVAKRVERALRTKQRALARCKKGSKRRVKVKAALSRLYTKTANTRRTYLHQVSAKLVRENDLIAIENLNVKGLAGSMLAKSVHDASWATLREFLTYKAEEAGRELIAVDPKFTSQTCPECGQVAKKKLKQRTHKCGCGCVLDRDHAAALVILQRAHSGALVSQSKAVAYA